MPAPALLLFLLLLIGPIALALWKGERLVEALASRRRRGRSRRRRRATRALPVRHDAIQAILGAEETRDRLEERIAETLSAFTRLRAVAPVDLEEAESVLTEVEEAVLQRESRFGEVLDCAWLQSESIELLDRQVCILREAAGLGRAAGPVRHTSRDAGQGPAGSSEMPAPVPLHVPEAPDPASEARGTSHAARRLLQSLEAAARRRAEVDRKIGKLEQSRPPEADPLAPSQDPPAGPGPGRRIDFTVGEDES